MLVLIAQVLCFFLAPSLHICFEPWQPGMFDEDHMQDEQATSSCPHEPFCLCVLLDFFIEVHRSRRGWVMPYIVMPVLES